MKVLYACELCGYEYDPKEGDPENGIAPKTEFEDLPAGWTCPMCGASKDDFEAEEVEDDTAVIDVYFCPDANNNKGL